MKNNVLQTVSVELRKLEAEQVDSISGASLVPNISNNLSSVQHDAKKKVFAVVIENNTQILSNEKPTFSIRMAYLGIFTYTAENLEKNDFLQCICSAAETVYYAAIFPKITELTTAFGIAPLRAYITSIAPEQIKEVQIEEADLSAAAELAK